MMDTVVFTDPKAVEYFTDHMVLVAVNAEEDTALAQQYHVSGYPTFVLVRPDGSEIDRALGFYAVDEFVMTLNNYEQGIGTLDDLLAKVQDSVDRVLYMEIANKYKYRGGADEATAWFMRTVDAGSPTDSLSGEARIALADMKRRAKAYDEAVALLNVIEADFESGQFAALASIYRAINFRQKGDTAAAVSEFERFLEVYPQSEDTAYAQKQIVRLSNSSATKNP